MKLIRVGEDLIDEETGEYAGPADTTLPEEIFSEEHLVLFMRRLMDAEVQLEAKKRELDIVIENCRKMVKQQEARVNWLRYRYESSAGFIAQAALPRRQDGTYRSKTWTCPWGQVAFREVKPTVEVADEQEAIAWAEENCPDAVKVSKRILITPVKEAMNSGKELPTCFKPVPAREAVLFRFNGSKDFEDKAVSD
jgi:hypothetical protein